MSIRDKILLSIVTTLSFLIILIYLCLSNFILNNCHQIEAKTLYKDIQRVSDIINQEINQLKITSEDWSKWHDTYNFVLNNNRDYVISYLANDSFKNLNINFFLLFDSDKKLVFAKAYDLKNQEEMYLPWQLYTYLSKDNILLNHQNKNSYYQGFVLIPDGLVMIVSTPVVNNQKNSPIVGSLLLGRYLTTEHIEELEARLSMKISLDKFVQDETGNNYLNKLAKIEKHQDKQDLPILIDVIDKNNLAAYTPIKDIESKPVSLLKVQQSREIYQTGQISLRYFIISLVILWVFFSCLIIFLLDKLIIIRLIDISKTLELINVNNLDRRLKVNGNDELALLSISINYLLDKIAVYTNELNRQILIDGLTQIPNRKNFDEYLQQQWEYCLETQQPLSLILFDIDFFKNYNDTYGHPMGDDCLIKIATLINNLFLFPQGLAARYGGEEFGIILPNIDYQNAIEVAKKLQQQVKQAEIVHESSSLTCKYVTISIGIATVIPRQGLSPRRLIETADEQLYHSKHQGRDRISVNLLSNLK